VTPLPVRWRCMRPGCPEHGDGDTPAARHTRLTGHATETAHGGFTIPDAAAVVARLRVVRDALVACGMAPEEATSAMRQALAKEDA
jgi:hypothetical protein